MSDDFRLGFVFLEEVAGGKLFDEETKLAIERGDIQLVRVQWAATKALKPVPQFLQLADRRLRSNHRPGLGDHQ